MTNTNTLKQMVQLACNHENLAGMEATVEKELLHYDVMAALSQSGLLSELVFQGGTCLRMAYGSERLSEDLDFTGGRDFTPKLYNNLAEVLIDYFKPRYGLDIVVKQPKNRAFNPDSVKVGRWMIVIETRPDKKGTPKQKIKLEVANIPSYSKNLKAIRLNYPNLQSGLDTVLVNCESESEILADKVVALLLRKFIKARDLWDLVMLNQQGHELNFEWIANKLNDYQSQNQPLALIKQIQSKLPDYWASGDFEAEMKRFLPITKVEQTLEQPQFMDYFVGEIDSLLLKTAKQWQTPITKQQFKL